MTSSSTQTRTCRRCAPRRPRRACARITSRARARCGTACSRTCARCFRRRQRSSHLGRAARTVRSRGCSVRGARARSSRARTVAKWTVRWSCSPVNAIVAWCDLLFSASDDKTVRAWDLASDTCVSVLDLHFLGAVTCLAVGPGHHDVQLYTGSDRCRVFNVSPKVIESGARIECVHTLEHHAAAITSIAVAEWHPPPDSEDPRGWRLYTGSADRTILVYDTVVGPAASLPPCTDAATARCTQKAERPVGRRRRCGGAGGLGPTPESKLIVPDPAAPQRRRFSVGCTSREARRPRAC
jgi:hypothetical protein